MKNRGAFAVAVSLMALMAFVASVSIVGNQAPGTRRYVPTINVAGAPPRLLSPLPPSSGQPLYLYLRKENNFPALFGVLRQLGLYTPNGLIVPTAHWQVLNMDADTFRDRMQQAPMDTVQIEILDEVSCIIVDSHIDPKWFRAEPAPTEETTLPFDVRQKYPQYFSAVAPTQRK